MEKIRAEEKTESFGYKAMTAFIFFCVILLTDTDANWAWYFKVLFSIGLVAYYVGYYRCYPVFYEWMMRTHPMRHSANYRMTDGHILAWLFSNIWPLLWLGRVIVLSIKRSLKKTRRASA